jgi:hypothetical protein
MKKGQGVWGIVVGFGVIAFLVVVIFWAFRPTTTGQAVVNEETKENNYLGEPFNLAAWVVGLDGIRLDIENDGGADYIVEDVEIMGCGNVGFGREVKKGDSEIFFVECSLVKGENFDGIIFVRYLDDGEEHSSTGNVKDVV